MTFCEKIHLAKIDTVAIITIENPPVNSLTAPVLEGLEQCVSYIKGQDDIYVTILTGGAGKSFIAGADIKEFSTWSAHEMLRRTRYGQKVLAGLEQLSIPTIAAINGYALGGGLETALCCDIRIASEKASLGLPEAKLGIIPGYGGTSRLPMLIGEGNAKKVIYMAKPVPAGEALKLGIVQEVVPHEQLMERAMDIAAQISSVAPIALKNIKNVIASKRTGDIIQSLENEVLATLECYYSEDRKEGIDAFLNKRSPAFKNN